MWERGKHPHKINFLQEILFLRQLSQSCIYITKRDVCVHISDVGGRSPGLRPWEMIWLTLHVLVILLFSGHSLVSMCAAEESSFWNRVWGIGENFYSYNWDFSQLFEVGSSCRFDRAVICSVLTRSHVTVLCQQLGDIHKQQIQQTTKKIWTTGCGSIWSDLGMRAGIFPLMQHISHAVSQIICSLGTNCIVSA